jgi:hypothetical protein
VGQPLLPLLQTQKDLLDILVPYWEASRLNRHLEAAPSCGLKYRWEKTAPAQENDAPLQLVRPDDLAGCPVTFESPESDRTTTLVLADDHEVVRQGLRAALGAEPLFRVIGETGDGLETTRLVERLLPDVFVLA